jgi:hypothetical protein
MTAFLKSMLDPRFLALAFASAFAVSMAAPSALAQSRARIFGIELGSPVAALPADQWVEPACGTDGGPPSLRLASFADFARCPVEAATGLREIWFIYDDEWEYIARAYGDPVEIRSFSANVFYGQPIMTSLLVDDGGLVQGYRVVTDPRAPTTERMTAYELHATFKALFAGAPWQCVALPREDREDPVEGVFLKEDCVMAFEGRFIRLEGRHLRKPGQASFAIPPEGYFESSVRLEVYHLDAVSDAPCCEAPAR